MGYIKFAINSRLTDEEGYPKTVRIGRLESDMADVNTNELFIIMHALAIKVSDEGKINISDGTSSLDLSFSGGKPIIYSSAWPSQSDVPSGGVFMDGDGYLKIKG